MRVALLLLLALLPVLAGAVNKCVDPAGKVGYQDIPCPKGSQASVLEPIPGPTDVQVAQAQELAAREALLAAQIRPVVEHARTAPQGPYRAAPTDAEAAPQPTLDSYYGQDDWLTYPVAYPVRHRTHGAWHKYHVRPFQPHPEPRAPHMQRNGSAMPVSGARAPNVNPYR
jgi:hypothetical protein